MSVFGNCSIVVTLFNEQTLDKLTSKFEVRKHGFRGPVKEDSFSKWMHFYRLQPLTRAANVDIVPS